MAKLKPWYQVVTPREDLREDRPLDASEFAVHLDHIRAQRAHDDYLKPERFFERTYLTHSLMDLSSQVVRRLSGMQVETSAVFNMATQFGGGKTHALTALYHLANGGQAAQNWKGVAAILSRARVPAVPRADVAVFVGAEFDVVDGRGGDGEPQRKTPWGEIAWQLGGAQALAVVAKHDALGTAPGGDVIRRMLPAGPVLILMDELLNYVSRGRRSGLADQLFNFLQNLSEEARARDNLVLCVSIPTSELEMNPQDQRDYEALKKLLDRVGRAISMANETEVTEIIRRRLFEWYGLPDEGKRTAAAYAAWAAEHAPELANLGAENPVEVFRNAYPFHPSVISVFERKWQALPRFQRTRGILRLLALWVARAYRDAHRRAVRDPLITLGSAPLEDQMFRDAVFEQLGSDQLSIPVTTDIVGKTDAHAVRLDREATEAIKKARLHQRVSTIIFFESNGGQSQSKADAALPEIKAAVGGPEMHLAELDTVLEGLLATCYYLHAERNRYRFGLRPNLNQMLVTRRGAIPAPALDERVRKTIIELFNQVSKDGPKSLDRRYFPLRSTDVPDRPQLTLVVLDLDHLAGDASTHALIEQILRASGSAGRTFKTGLLFAVPDATTAMVDAARTLLAWEDISDDTDAVGQLEESQQRTLTHNLGRARADLREAVWRAYRRVFFLTQDNRLKDLDLGHVTSSMAPSITELIVNTLVRDDEITTGVGPARLVRIWPPAMTAWSTKAVRDAFFASPALPRLLDPDAIKRTIADGVSAKLLGYAHKDSDGRLVLDRFGESLLEAEVEISDDVYLLRAADAQKLVEPPQLASLVLHPERVEVGPEQHVTFRVSGLDQYGQGYAVDTVEWSAHGCTIDAHGHLVASEAPGVYTVTARSGALHGDTHIRVVATPPEEEKPKPDGAPKTIRWRGTIPPQKWMNFYTKVLSKFVSSPGLTLQVGFEVPADSEHVKTNVDDIKSALRDLGLDEDATLS